MKRKRKTISPWLELAGDIFGGICLFATMIVVLLVSLVLG